MTSADQYDHEECDDVHERDSIEAEACFEKPKTKMSLFLTRFNNEEDHVPSSNDFLVYQIKKNYKMKVFRFYQCRCSQLKKKRSPGANTGKFNSSNKQDSSNV